MSQEYKQSVHSDILIHWTGKDIDATDPDFTDRKVNHRKRELNPLERPSLTKDYATIREYLKRLKNTLKYGIWLLNDESSDKIRKSARAEGRMSRDDGRQYDTTNISRASFTELKLSEVRKHAYEYGRLGFGLKRFYLFDRGGQPMFYPKVKSNSTKPNWFLDNDSQFTDEQKSFFKGMCESEDLNYKYYSESEWRIICPHDFSMSNKTLDAIRKYFIDIKGELSEEVKKYSGKVSLEELERFLNECKNDRLRYLMPMDYWLSVIVYPSPRH